MFSRWRRKKIQAQSNTLTTSEDLALLMVTPWRYTQF